MCRHSERPKALDQPAAACRTKAHPHAPPSPPASPYPCPRLLACSIIRENAWQSELKGDVTRQRRLEAVDKLMSVLTLVVAAVFGVQALGLDVNSGGYGWVWLGVGMVRADAAAMFDAQAMGLDVKSGGHGWVAVSG